MLRKSFLTFRLFITPYSFTSFSSPYTNHPKSLTRTKAKSVTYVFGTKCNLCVQNEPPENSSRKPFAGMPDCPIASLPEKIWRYSSFFYTMLRKSFLTFHLFIIPYSPNLLLLSLHKSP